MNTFTYFCLPHVRFASDDMQADKDVVTCAIRSNGTAIEYGDDEDEFRDAVVIDLYPPGKAHNLVAKGKAKYAEDMYAWQHSHCIAEPK